MLNVNNLKTGIKEINNYIGEPKEYKFYYDETNNYKKVRIRETGLNDENAFFKNYVLGGICFRKEEEQNIDVSELFNTQLKKYSTGEIKGSRLFKDCSTFLDCLNKSQVTSILEWIDKNCFIHYSSKNCLYYAIADVVDSFFTDIPKLPLTREFLDIMKSQIYHLIFNFKEEFIKIANEINYPNIEEKDIPKFCDWLINLIDKVNQNDKADLSLARQIISEKRNAKSLIFLQSNEEKTIIEEFYTLRQQRCIFFDNSYHIFDNESDDEKLMKKYPFTKDDINVFKNYEFKDSKTDRFIQISDVITSLLARFFDFIDNNSFGDIYNSLLTANDIQRKNLKKLIKIINKSNEEESFFLCTINSIDLKIYRDNIINQLYNIIN